MEMCFKAFGSKGWGVKEDVFVYNGKEIPYSELTFFKLVTTPTTSLTNGVAQAGHNGKILVCGFKYSDKEAAHEAINYISEKIEQAQGVFKSYKYKFTSHTGTTLEVYEEYIIIYHMQVGSLITNVARGGTLGGKRINYSELTAIQFKEPSGVTIGFIQFAYPGSIENKGGVIDMLNDENSVPVQLEKVGQAREIVEYIENQKAKILKSTKDTIIQQVSSADEIKKFKELLDMGVITKEEFELKKKQLLGI